MPDPPGTDPGAAEDATFSRYEPETCFGSALFDARNGFNEISRYLMLLNVAHRWNWGSRFASNKYWHWVCCLVRSEPGEPALVIHSKEGDHAGRLLCDEPIQHCADAPHIQDACGNPLGLAAIWYCDDVGVAGKAMPNARYLDFHVKYGPVYGYFPVLHL